MARRLPRPLARREILYGIATPREELVELGHALCLKHRDDPNVRTDLGTCYKRMGILDKARAEYERVLREHPAHIQATYNLAVVSALAGDQRRAAELWERVAAMAPGTPLARASLKHAAEAKRAAGRPATNTPPSSPEGDPRP